MWTIGSFLDAFGLSALSLSAIARWICAGTVLTLSSRNVGCSTGVSLSRKLAGISPLSSICLNWYQIPFAIVPWWDGYSPAPQEHSNIVEQSNSLFLRMVPDVNANNFWLIIQLYTYFLSILTVAASWWQLYHRSTGQRFVTITWVLTLLCPWDPVIIKDTIWVLKVLTKIVHQERSTNICNCRIFHFKQT